MTHACAPKNNNTKNTTQKTQHKKQQHKKQKKQRAWVRRAWVRREWVRWARVSMGSKGIFPSIYMLENTRYDTSPVRCMPDLEKKAYVTTSVSNIF